ncbi:exodeoxyribonuclease V alpha subunit [Halolactibacillus halophilus]|uniref:ATP-dependent RecD2 DNA helicase n=1 Tax=Halolactibacillus halophilus TaxID=306540 RepID=A0A1I5KX47_9BACI|nr:ATP-dependent RecD-like DNA helicase [Halolactibacillus halophilus]GEM00546.1 ATP-dependent RecD-like DNA helicase [Halolactibacillus halophilus]SFO89679.1 exodeoxyribonuclease V alpha subunit [Halolactibacillus halophilus]
MSEETKYIRGELIYTIYTNQAEHFSIAKIKVLKTNEAFDEDELVVKGYFGEIFPGEAYVFYGTFVHHKKFGEQYHVDHYERYVPKTEEGLVSYLSSDLFPKIGKKTASRIVEALGDGAINKIIKEPDVLKDIKGLNDERRTILVERLKTYQGFDTIVVALQKVGIGLKLAQKIYQHYQDEAINILEENPYQYVFDIEGFGFHRADLIATDYGISLNHPSRIRAGILYILNESLNDGHVFLPVDKVKDKVNRLLEARRYGITDEMLTKELIEMAEEEYLVEENDRVYLPVSYYAEAGLTTQLKRISELEVEETVVEADLLKVVGEVEEEEHLTYGKVQYDAIKQALMTKVMILTGGPGTGKTTVIKGILKAYSELNDVSMKLQDYTKRSEFPYILTAPTGRAAKRITESTGLPAYTIHRLLGWDGHQHFEKTQDNPLEGKMIIIDEFSMVDVFLANQLFKAIPSTMQVLLVGDEDQLPSVGPGQVLSDLLHSQQVTQIKLDEVYRQKEGSKIITLAHRIKHDELTADDLIKASDFNFIPCQRHQLLHSIETIVTRAIARGFDIQDIQILAPMYKTDVGINEINTRIQSVVNPKRKGARELHTKDTVFRTGDKVIQLVNQPEDNVFNGDIGKITAIFWEKENVEGEDQVIVTFEDDDVTYTRQDLLNITHAYCISIHKSQGSEFPIVVMPVDRAYRRMLRKNLLYTAMTRAKQSLIICGDQSAFLEGVTTIDTNERYTTLIERLTGVFTDEDYREQLEEDLEEQALEGEEVSPFDFM